jgi:hypothetical protein
LKANTTGSVQVAIGHSAAKSNTTGQRNLAIGYRAYEGSDTENDNIAIGYNAMVTDTAGGTLNVAVGNYALDALTSADRNTAIGHSAGSAITTGGSNTAVGAEALTACVDAVGNTCIGDSAGNTLTSSGVNVCVGANAGDAITTGDGHNIVIGFQAASYTRNLTSGQENIYIGAYSYPSSSTIQNEIAIGYGAAGKGTATAFIGGSNGAYQGDNATAWKQTSDERLKKNIVNNDIGLSKINKIQVRSFEYKNIEEVEADGVIDKDQTIKKTGTQIGVIAQELELVLPNCVKTTSSGVKSIITDDITWHMLNAVKELSAKNDALLARIETLEG